MLYVIYDTNTHKHPQFSVLSFFLFLFRAPVVLCIYNVLYMVYFHNTDTTVRLLCTYRKSKCREGEGERKRGRGIEGEGGSVLRERESVRRKQISLRFHKFSNLRPLLSIHPTASRPDIFTLPCIFSSVLCNTLRVVPTFCCRKTPCRVASYYIRMRR